MIDEVDARVKAWAEQILAGLAQQRPQDFSKTIPVALEAPHDAAGDGVSLYLLALAEKPPLQGAQRAPLQFCLRYLVTAWAEQPSRAHAMLGELLFAALEKPEYEVQLEDIPPAIWASFGIAPRPTFLLRVPVSKERPPRLAQPVREPLRVEWIDTARVDGVVLGPGDSPLPGVRVALMPQAGDTPLAPEYARLCPATVTGADGMFTFAAIPRQPRYTFCIHIKDQELFVSLAAGSADAPLVLRWGLLAAQATRDGRVVAGGCLRLSRGGAGERGPLLLCEADRDPLRGLRVEYPAGQLTAPLDTQGQGYLLLQEKALYHAGQWLPKMRWELISANGQLVSGTQVAFPSLNLSLSTDSKGR